MRSGRGLQRTAHAESLRGPLTEILRDIELLINAEQAFDLRPVPGSRRYEGPIGGLYLCGSGAWPGGCVMGAPGHNAAQEVLAARANAVPSHLA